MPEAAGTHTKARPRRALRGRESGDRRAKWAAGDLERRESTHLQCCGNLSVTGAENITRHFHAEYSVTQSGIDRGQRPGQLGALKLRAGVLIKEASNTPAGLCREHEHQGQMRAEHRAQVQAAEE